MTAQCLYQVCREVATEQPPAVPVPLCAGHRIIAEHAVRNGAAAHITPDGALYVGDLDELLARPSRP